MLSMPGPQHTERGESPMVPYSAGVSCWKSSVLKARFPAPRGFSRWSGAQDHEAGWVFDAAAQIAGSLGK
jgi:hypothetical protein